ncbi:DivIVA domain-containing protein [Streptomyces sp. RB6PN25]|uniref:DivIVA domain-containing protein n=1 Tax=Streptomyces humicola TaxID=2953240 RepID=A0ABT1PRB3_9ACTN|nr:DivIVA domain-containing protein [Streptomyces humicola]MCQ4080207.1 DivIVA domain-containing protein [Streptomyces humicola]
MFWFMLIALVAVVAAVALAVLGDGEVLGEAEPDRLHDPLPDDRPLGRADLDALRLPTALRGYRMSDVDDVLDRLGAELTERDARIAELEAALAGAHAAQQRPQPLRSPEPPQPPHRPGGPR